MQPPAALATEKDAKGVLGLVRVARLFFVRVTFILANAVKKRFVLIMSRYAERKGAKQQVVNTISILASYVRSRYARLIFKFAEVALKKAAVITFCYVIIAKAVFVKKTSPHVRGAKKLIAKNMQQFVKSAAMSIVSLVSNEHLVLDEFGFIFHPFYQRTR